MNSYYGILFVLLAINLVSFILVFLDKQKSRDHDQRVPEVQFFVWSIFFSSLGVLAGMYVFRHKTHKLSFVLGIGLLLIQQLALTYFILQLWL